MINKSLSETIAQVEQRNQVLQNKVALLKGYKKVIKNAENISCKHCQIFQNAHTFADHLKVCNKEVKP